MNLQNWEYGDEKIGNKESVFVISSIIIGVGILTLPRNIAKATHSSDGWISIMIAGIAVMLIAWMLARFTNKFHNRSYIQVISDSSFRPIAVAAAILYGVYYALFTSYIARAVADLSKQYLFERTPIEVIALLFLLVVIYAVAGSRVGIVRLSVLFLPFVILITFVFLLLSFNLFHAENLLPMFHSGWTSILDGSKETIFSFLGFETVLFYGTLMRNSGSVTKSTMISVVIAILLYVLIYLFVTSIFSPILTENIMYPTIELARGVTVPGGFFERLESLFLIFWLLSIFVTASISLDITVLVIRDVVKIKKATLLFILSPFIYLITMLPEDVDQLSVLASLVSYLGIGAAVVLPLFFMLLLKLKEVKTRV